VEVLDLPSISIHSSTNLDQASSLELINDLKSRFSAAAEIASIAARPVNEVLKDECGRNLLGVPLGRAGGARTRH